MKKTITIISLVCAFVASAQETELPTITLNTTHSSSNAALSWTPTEDFTATSLENYALTFTVSTLAESTSYTFLTTWGGNYLRGLGIAGSQENGITLVVDNGTAITNAPSVEYSADAVYTLAVIDGVAYLWSGDKPTTTPSDGLTLSTLTYAYTRSDGNEQWAITSGTTKMWANGTGANAKSIATWNTLTDLSGVTTAQYFNASSAGGNDAIPEPTTATLSLLALAGLAARRRRK